MGDSRVYNTDKVREYIHSGEAGLEALIGLDLIDGYNFIHQTIPHDERINLAIKVSKEYFAGFSDKPSCIKGKEADYFQKKGKHYAAGYLSKFSICGKLAAKLSLHPKSKCYKAAKQALGII